MIKRSVVLPCRPERAFALFTEHAGEWWPAERRHTKDAASTICIEATGRFFERAQDGTEVELGVVRLFEPTGRLVLDWYPGTGRTNPTQVDVRFEAVAEGTRVTVTHGPGTAGADLFGRNAAAYDRSWDLVLTSLASQGEAVFDIP
jgi:Activator of Hsp90 ATPase homolog 1-like protein